MRVTPTALPEVLLVEPRVFGDARGWFFESFHAARYAEHGIAGPFVQDNASRSARGTLRGLHLQHPRAQGKLVSVAEGAVLDVAVDVRVGSPTFGRHVAVELTSDDKRQLWVPPGFAHGFYVLSESALFTYKCTDYYAPEAELAVAWDDPAVGVRWPSSSPILSARDAAAPRLEALMDRLPRYRA
jgi:dTDP-4-dehydrorhamnose 3,5-epimerase